MPRPGLKLATRRSTRTLCRRAALTVLHGEGLEIVEVLHGVLLATGELGVGLFSEGVVDEGTPKAWAK